MVHINSQTSRVISLTCGVPQGSVLGLRNSLQTLKTLIMFSTAMDFITTAFADETQMYITTPRSDAHTIAPRLQKCIADVSDWCGSRRLQLNEWKTEIIWLGSKAILDILSQSTCTESVRDLGTYLDSELNMRAHVAKTTQACFYQIRRLRQIRCLLGRTLCRVYTSATSCVLRATCCLLPVAVH